MLRSLDDGFDEHHLPTKATMDSLAQFRKDAIFFTNRYEALRIEYPDQFVAIYSEKVVGHDANSDTLLERLREKEFNPAHVLVERTYFKDQAPTYMS